MEGLWKDFSPENKLDPLDQDGHGTYTSGIAAGTGADNPDLRGVAPGAVLLVARIGIDQNEIEAAVPNPIDPPPVEEIPAGRRMIDAINWCRDNRVTHGIEIISISAGMGVDPAILCYDGTDLLSQTANAAVADGMVFIAAAGNDGPRACSVHQPAVGTDVIAVGMMGDPRNVGACSGAPEDAFEASNGWYLNYFGSRGRAAQVKPEIVAPGVCIRAPWKFPIHLTEVPYQTATGTSAAAPFVAGVVALMLDRNPGLIDTVNQRVNVAEVKRILYETAQQWGPDNDPSSTVRKSYDYGFGNLRAWQAIKEACGASCAGPQAPGQPDHHFVTGALDALHVQQTWQLQNVGTEWPIAVTMVRPDTTPTSDKFSVTLRSPSDVEVASSVGTNRHEQLTYEPAVAGTYTVKVRER